MYNSNGYKNNHNQVKTKYSKKKTKNVEETNSDKKKGKGIVVVILLLLFFGLVIYIATSCQSANKSATYTIHYNTNGGSVLSYYQGDGKNYILPMAPIREGYNFLGWYLEADFKTRVNNLYFQDNPLSRSIILYAKWEQKQVYKWEEIFEWESDNKGSYIITKFLKTEDTEVVIPNLIYDVPVIDLKAGLFKNYTNLKTINFDNNKITKFPNDLFNGCTALTHFTIPSTITSIGQYAFANTGIVDLAIPNTVTNLDKYAFANNFYLKNIVLPTNITKLEDGLFENCSNLVSITNSELTPTASRPFQNKDIELINISAKIVTIGNDVFKNDSSITSLNIPDSVLIIGDGAFSNCYALTKIKLPANLSVIGAYLLENDTSLTSIILPDKVVSVKEGAFAGCSNLETLEIPKGASSIGSGVLRNVESIKTISVPFVGNERNSEDNAFVGWLFGASSIDSSSAVIPASLKNILVTGDSNIFPHSFEGLRNVETIEFSGIVQTVGEYAFKDCTSISKIILPNTVKTIGQGALQGCSSLIQLSIPFVGNSSTSLTNSHFGWIFGSISYTDNNVNIPAGLKNITLSNTTSIPDNAFRGVSKLNSVSSTLPISKVGNYAFSDCINITSFSFISSLDEIGNYSFANCSNITSITLSPTLSKIGERAFQGCTKVTSLVLPDSLISIGIGAFYGFSGLTSISIPFSGSSKTTTAPVSSRVLRAPLITNSHFGYIFGALNVGENNNFVPSSLKSINITNSTLIDESSFSGLVNVTAITFSNKVTQIGSLAFNNCTSLQSISLPEGLVSIGSGAFTNCNSITELTLPFVGLNSDGGYLGQIFGASSIGASSASIPATLKIVNLTKGTTIRTSAFQGCANLEQIHLPNTITTIEESAFEGCTKLSSLTLSTALTTIDNKAFKDCTALKTFVLPNSLTSIGTDILKGSTNITDLTIPFSGATKLSDGIRSIGYLYGSSTYTDDINQVGSLTNVTITSNTEIPNNAFYNLTSIKSINITGNPTKIGNYAFYGLSNLISLVLPNTVNSLGDYAISGCTKLESFTIPTSLKTLNSHLFDGDTKLTKLNLSGVVTIKEKALKNCTSLNEVTLSSSLRTIEDNVFEGTTSLLELEIPKEVTSIGGEILMNSHVATLTLPFIGLNKSNLDTLSYIYDLSLHSIGDYLRVVNVTDSVEIAEDTFRGGEYLTNINLNNAITTIGSNAFEFCESLESITLPSSLLSISDHLFSEATSLASLVIPDSVEEIGVSPFAGCTALVSLTIGSGVKEINTNSLSGITNIEEIILPNTLESIGDNAFEDDTHLLKLTVPNSVESIGTNFLKGCIRLTELSIPYTGSTLDVTSNTGLYKFFDVVDNTYLPETLIKVIISSGTAVKENAFKNAVSITSVEIADSIVRLSNSAFEGCTGLSEAILSDSLKYIGNSAFKGCTFESIDLPSSVESIGESAFENCIYLEEVVIPSTVLTLGLSSFKGCSSLSEIELPFTGYDGEENSHVGYIFGSTLVSGQDSFIPASLSKITINGISIGESAFEAINNDLEIVLADTIEVIGVKAFKSCNLTTINYPLSLKTIGDSAFENCINLVEVAIPEGLEELGEAAFKGCTSLEKITIPKSIVTISNGVLEGCEKLEVINIPFIGQEKDEEGEFFGWIFGEAAAGSVTKIPTSLTSVTLSNQTKLYENSFSDISREFALSFPVLKSIEENGLKDFTGLKELNIPSTLETIETLGLKGCVGLKGLIIPSTVKFLGFGFIQDCTGLESISVPFLGETIDDTDAQNNNFNHYISRDSLDPYEFPLTNLKSIILTGQTSLINSSFEYVGDVTITLPNTIKTIGDFVFYGSKIKSIVFPNSVETIGSRLFTDCEDLISIGLNSGLKTIGNQAFMEIPSITSISLPNSVESLGAEAFLNCLSLESYFIGPNVTTFNEGLFRGCSALTEVRIPETVTIIKNYAFAEIKAQSRVVIPDTVTEIGINVFYKTVVNDLSVPFLGETESTLGETSTLKRLFNNYNEAEVTNYVAIRTIRLTKQLVVPANAFKGATGINNFVLLDDVTEFGVESFSGCTSLPNSFVFPVSLTKIKQEAFKGCTGLTDVVVPNTVTRLAFGIFYDCSNLESISLPFTGDKLTEVTAGTTHLNWYFGAEEVNDSFYPSKLTTVTITNSNEVRDYAFSNGAKLSTINLPTTTTEIGASAFLNCVLIEDPLKGLTSITKIKQNAFENCINITVFIIPDSVTEVGIAIFKGCTRIEVLEVPFTGDKKTEPSAGTTHLSWYFGNVNYDSDPTVLSNLHAIRLTSGTTVRENAFSYAEDTALIYIPSDVTTFEDRAFLNCKNLHDITLPSTLTTIGAGAFENCILFTSMTLLDNLEEIGFGIFKGCTSLQYLTIPFTGNKKTNPDENTTHLSWYFGRTNYDDVDSSTSLFFGVAVSPSTTVTEIRKNAFSNLEALDEINLGNNITSIGDKAFFNCLSLTEIDLSSTNLTSIGDFAFEGSAIEELTIPNSVTEIGFGILKDCDSLESLNTPFTGDNLTSPSTATTHLSWYFGRENRDSSSFSFPDSLDSVSQTVSRVVRKNAFYDAASISTITIRDNTTEIGDFAFYNAISDNIFSLPSTVTTIGISAFENNENVQKIEIPSGVTTIGINAFKGCTHLSWLIVPFTGNKLTSPTDGTTHLGWYFGAAVAGENADYVPATLERIDISASTVIQKYAFNELKKIKYFYLEPTITEFKDYSFAGTGLSSFTFPDGLTTIGNNVFQDCVNFVNITIPNTITKIGQQVFNGCTSLATLSIPYVGETKNNATNAYFGWLFGAAGVNNNGTNVPESLVTVAITSAINIYASAMKDLTDIVTVTLPDTLKEIKENAFKGCESLIGITIPKNVTALGTNSFEDCKALTSFTMSSENTNTLSYANSMLYNCTSLVSITIPKNVNLLGLKALGSCTKLTTVLFDARTSANLTISNQVFIDDKALIEFEFPSNQILRMGNKVFEGCTSLQSLSIPYLGEKLFGPGNSTKLARLFSDKDTWQDNTTELPESLKEVTISAGYQIYDHSFAGAIHLTTINILNDDMGTIDPYAFFGCTSLTTVNLPANLEIIGDSAFQNCTSLEELELPRKLTTIGSSLLSGCTSLTTLKTPYIGKNYNSNTTSESILAYLFGALTNNLIPTSLRNVYVTGSSNLEGSMTTLAADSLRSLQYVEYIEISDNYTSIGESAFDACPNLMELILGENLESIGAYALSGLGRLTSIDLPESLLSIGNFAFSFSSNIDSITLYEGLTSIGEGAFNGLSKLSSLVIPQSVETIGARIFSGCSGLESLTLPFLGNTANAAERSAGTEKLSWYFNVSSHSNSVMQNLRSIILTNETRINDRAFYEATFLQSITVNEGLLSIGGEAFMGCSSLITANIPSGVELGERAFAGTIFNGSTFE